MGLGLFHHPLPLEKDLSSNPMLLLHHHYVNVCGWMVSIRFCVFLLGYYKSVFLIGLAAHLFFWAEIEFKVAVYFLRNVWVGVDQIQARLI